MTFDPLWTNAKWRKARASGGGNGACVEVAAVGSVFGVRDSKDKTGPVLGFSSHDWKVFVDDARAGRFAP